ncbi:hypothetical protein KY345_01230 [Candidatus Woesearchaeota archaeon]|nr:hypothetical protein [Candidatus Woesearchaeota archaeon]
MKIIATDVMHAAKLPPYLVSYMLSERFNRPFPDFGTIGLKPKIAKELDGLECLIPASLTVNSEKGSKRLDRLMRCMDRLRKKYPGFDYYAFHGLYENQAPQLKEYELNLADNNTKLKRKDIEGWISKQIVIARLLSGQKKPVLNLHLGNVAEKFDMRESICNIESIIKSCLGKDDSVQICFENMPPAEKGYNIFQNPEDLMYFDGLLELGGITYDISHLECARYRRNRGITFAGSDKNIGHFRKFHDEFLTVYREKIKYMHWVFNDITLLEREPKLDPYYGIDRHTPPSRISNSRFGRYAFEPITRKALRIIQQNMGENACINVEVPRKRVFFTTYCRDGASERELIRSYQYARRLARDI